MNLSGEKSLTSTILKSSLNFISYIFASLFPSVDKSFSFVFITTPQMFPSLVWGKRQWNSVVIFLMLL